MNWAREGFFANVTLHVPVLLRKQRAPVQWVAILYGHLNIDIVITGGLHSAEDLIKSVMAGATLL